MHHKSAGATMTMYQSILPSSAVDIDSERTPLTLSYDYSFQRRENAPRKWYLWIPLFVLGVLGVAVLFVLKSSSSSPSEVPEDNLSSPQSQQQQTTLPIIVEFNQWEEWKEEMVQAAQHFRSDVSQAWNDGNNEKEEALVLQDWWGPTSEQAQAWWQDIATSTQEWMKHVGKAAQDDASRAGEFLSKEENQTMTWAQQEEQDAGEWIKSTSKNTKEWAQETGKETGDLLSHARNKTEELTNSTSHKAKHMAGNAAENTKEWAKNAENTTGHWIGDEAKNTKEWAENAGNTTGHWIGDEAEKTKEWAENAGNTTGHWIGKESKQVGGWFKKEAGEAGAAAKKAEHWAGDEMKDAGGWIRKEGNATWHEAEKASEWVGDEMKDAGGWIRKEGNATWHEAEKAGEWVGDETKRGATGTKQWFEKESNVTERWISREARASAHWFRKEARDAGSFFKKEANATGNFFQKESNRTVHWFEADAEAVRIWWNNITHRGQVLDESLVYFNTTAAFALLVSGYGWYDSSRDFFTFQEGFDVQENQAYCSVASAAAVINSFRGRLDLPTDPIFNPYPYATQNNLFNECTDENVIVHNETFDGILSAPGGLNLDQAKALLECNLPSTGWSIEARHVDPSNVTLDDMRKDLVLSLMSPTSRVIVNFNRAAAGQVGGGHFSPLGGYSHERDAFLLMDVAKYKYPYVWIPAPVLYRALMTVDACGSLNSPADAQAKLKKSHHEHSQPKTARSLAKAMSELGCKAAYRGYLIAKQL
jgi:hypothetical protein